MMCSGNEKMISPFSLETKDESFGEALGRGEAEEEEEEDALAEAPARPVVA